MALPHGNRLIDRIAKSAARSILKNATTIDLERSQVTTVDARRMETVDFPVSALLSVVGTLVDGSVAEITNVGFEGFVEIDAALHHPFAKRTSICLFPGTAIRLPIEDFTAALDRDRAFSDLVYHAVRTRSFVTEELALCGVRHATEARLARWLLMTVYKLRSVEFTVTHEVLASILGVRRASVSIAAKQFQDAGALRYSRGRVTILDPAALKSLTCPCYEECIAALDEAL